MRYLVISACIDARSDKRFHVGDEFLPEPSELQAAALVAAGCLEPIPDDAPALPTDDLDGKNGSQLREIGRLEGVTIGNNVRIDDMRTLIRNHRRDLTRLDREALVRVAAAEQVDVAAEADEATLRDAISAKRAEQATA